jgi:EAL domain-containing protein (putative c-di-GMP-specific phosphodiesterase class I)
LAESTGFIVELDRYIINAAIRDFRKFRKKNLYFGRLSLNLSTKQLRQKDFIEFLQKTMQQNNFKPSWLELEVTESQIMQNPQEAIETLKRISSLGVKIAVDDFGTGYSSLSYLKKLPIDKLKIDKSFVQELPQDKESVAIIQAIIALAKALNLELMAEGVENKAQKDFMIQNGCNYIQGYYFSKPIARHEVENFIKNRYTSNKHFDIQEQK